MISQNPLTGRSRGKLANAVFSTWKGLNVVRSKPLEVHNPNTPLQLNARDAFRHMVTVGRALLPLLKVSYKEEANGMSEFNAFMKSNKGVITYDSGSIDEVNDTLLKVSKGSLAPISSGTKGTTTSTTCPATWSNTYDSISSFTNDAVKLVALDTGTGLVHVSTNASTRGAGTATFSFSGFNPTTAGAEFYLAVYNTGTGKAADSTQLA